MTLAPAILDLEALDHITGGSPLMVVNPTPLRLTAQVAAPHDPLVLAASVSSADPHATTYVGDSHVTTYVGDPTAQIPDAPVAEVPVEDQDAADDLDDQDADTADEADEVDEADVPEFHCGTMTTEPVDGASSSDIKSHVLSEIMSFINRIG